jgi:iron complex outermembrane recepter protein
MMSGHPAVVFRRCLAAVLLVAAVAASARAQAPATDLGHATLEDLMNVEITLASRKEQPADTVPAAVYVITRDDIERSGLTTLPELLRLVPGMQVARINSNNWAISIRGFNDLWANKLLVLVDGRSVYTRVFSGVFWNSQDFPVGDIERIEVIRGPGGSLWGANAVNGVINIITRSAANTKGALVSVGGGSHGESAVSARYGGSMGGAAYRVYSQWADHGQSVDAASAASGDDWSRFTNGFRLDWTTDANAITAEGSFVNGAARPLWSPIVGPTPALSAAVFEDANTSDGAGLVRWTHSTGVDSELQVQTWIDLRRRSDGNGVRQQENVFAADLQYQTKLPARQDLIVGGGYRAGNATTDGNLNYSLTSSDTFDRVLSLFAQDDIDLPSHFRISLGSKLEHDAVAGWGVQPTTRVMWEPAGSQHLWAAWSRALRTPSANDLGIRVNYAAFIGDRGTPVLLGFQGNPDYHTEELRETEAGYRVTFGTTTSADVTVFRGHYSHLVTQEPLAPAFEATPAPHLFVGAELANLSSADTSGVEVAARWMPATFSQIDASYSRLSTTPSLDAASHDQAASLFDGNAPTEQWQLHSAWWLGRRWQVDGSLFHVGRLRQLDVPAYTRVDLRLEVKLSKVLTLVAAGQNLLDPAHAEFANGNTGLTATLVPRTADLRLVWRF